jgi:hypothetical protein
MLGGTAQQRVLLGDHGRSPVTAGGVVPGHHHAADARAGAHQHGQNGQALAHRIPARFSRDRTAGAQPCVLAGVAIVDLAQHPGARRTESLERTASGPTP